MFVRPSRAVAACALVCALVLARPSSAASPTDATLVVTVVDAVTTFPLASVDIVAGNARAQTAGDGVATLVLPPGRYRLDVRRDGYERAQSSEVTLAPATRVPITLALRRRESSVENLRVIGQTAVRANESLQRSSVVERRISSDELAREQQYRAADAIRRLPGLAQTEGESASFGDDLHFDLRGIGALETVTLVDGHVAGAGLSKNYNWELSPIFGLRDIVVTYGSGGAGLTGVNAIGGTIDMRTLEPTLAPRVTFTQGAGTFGKLVTATAATGTVGRWGYALAAGSQGIDGPLHGLQYAPSAAFDPSAPALRSTGTYRYDSAVTNKSALLKLRYDLSRATHVTADVLSSFYYDNKTGNGDIDYLPEQVALAQGQADLAGKSANDPCPAGTFTATNAIGVANGTGPDGKPDGGVRCQTPAQYAAFNTGWSGVGTAWQTFRDNDYHVRLESGTATHLLTVDAFSNAYGHTTDRTFRLPFKVVPGDRPSWSFEGVTATGATIAEDVAGRNNTFGLGYTWVNSAYQFQTNGKTTTSPITHETAAFLRDVYHPERSPLAIYANAWFKSSTVTHTSYVDPRLALVYTVSRNDVVRVAAGGTTAQPYATYLFAPFTPAASIGNNGTISCSSPNAIGTAPSSTLKPEQASDEEVSLGHRWSGDSQTQVTFYNVNVYNKIYKAIAPLSQVGTGFIDPAVLAQLAAQVARACGASNVNDLLGVSGNVNVAHVQAQGIDVVGRQRLGRRVFVDYDWSVTSSALRSATDALLATNPALIPNAQLPLVPLHKANLALDARVAPWLSARYGFHFTADNNARNLPAYTVSDLTLTAPLRHGELAVQVDNLWNQEADIRGLLGLGSPRALNRLAPASAYLPFVGSAATERFSLPYRTIGASYTVRVR